MTSLIVRRRIVFFAGLIVIKIRMERLSARYKLDQRVSLTFFQYPPLDILLREKEGLKWLLANSFSKSQYRPIFNNF